MSDTLDALAIGASVIGSTVALAFSATIYIKDKFEQKHHKKTESLQSNASLLVEAWKQVAITPSVLRFHSICENELKKSNIKPEELSYLLILFEAADFYYQNMSPSNEPFPEGSLRYEILKSPETRRAWPFMKPFFIASTRYVHMIEATIALLDEKETVVNASNECL